MITIRFKAEIPERNKVMFAFLFVFYFFLSYDLIIIKRLYQPSEISPDGTTIKHEDLKL